MKKPSKAQVRAMELMHEGSPLYSGTGRGGRVFFYVQFGPDNREYLTASTGKAMLSEGWIEPMDLPGCFPGALRYKLTRKGLDAIRKAAA